MPEMWKRIERYSEVLYLLRRSDRGMVFWCIDSGTAGSEAASLPKSANVPEPDTDESSAVIVGESRIRKRAGITE